MSNPIPFESGKRFARLVTVRELPKSKSGRRVLCRCDCGKEFPVLFKAIRTGTTKSCGCLRSEYVAQKNFKHGMRKRNEESPEEYIAWKAMRQRCRYENGAKFKDYGARGITVCERWESFENFLADMGPKPGPEYSIERKDNDKGYCPENCKWGTTEEQANNKQKTLRFPYKGKPMTIRGLSNISGIPYERIYSRIRCGWSVERSITEAVRLGKNQNG